MRARRDKIAKNTLASASVISGGVLLKGNHRMTPSCYDGTIRMGKTLARIPK